MGRMFLNLFVFLFSLFVVFSFVYTKNHLQQTGEIAVPNEKIVAMQTGGKGLATAAIETEKRGVTPFTSLHVEAPVKVFLIVSDTPLLVLKGSRELLDQVVTEVTLEKLWIRGKKDQEWSQGIDGVELYVSVPKLQTLTLEGAGRIEGRGEFVIKELNVGIKGPGRIVLSMRGGQVFGEIEGSGEMLLIGVVDQETLQIKGAGKVEAVSLLAQNAVVKIDGKGEALVNVMQNLSVEIEGDGIVRFGGEPTLSKKISGNGQVLPL